MIKRFAFVVSLFVITLAAFGQDAPNGPALTFDKPNHDYGVIFVDDMPEFKLNVEFTNTGNQPLVLSAARACCGTQVLKWPREPINPGEKGTVELQFRLAPRAQRISRTLTLTSNSATNPTAIFRILGEVKDRE